MARNNSPFNASVLTMCLAISLLCSCSLRPNVAEVSETAEATVKPINTDTLTEITTPPPVETEEVVVATPSPTPEPFSPDLVKGEAMPIEFFNKSAFFGNSLVDGFRLFSGVVAADYFAKTSLTVNNAQTQISNMSVKEYDKIYILLGINEIGNHVDTFKADYAKMIDTIKVNNPESSIYIMSLTPVSRAKSAEGDTFSKERVDAYNKALYEIALEKECYYADIFTALANEEGFLPEKVTSDGVHFHAQHYLVWLEYLQTHYSKADGEKFTPPETELPEESAPTDGTTNSI